MSSSVRGYQCRARQASKGGTLVNAAVRLSVSTGGRPGPLEPRGRAIPLATSHPTWAICASRLPGAFATQDRIPAAVARSCRAGSPGYPNVWP